MSNRMLEASPDDRADVARTDLLATLAAGRELGPEMDAALAASYLEAHPARRAAEPRPAGGASSLNPSIARIGFVLGVVALVAAAVASGGHALWLLWLPLVLGRWWWGPRWRPRGGRWDGGSGGAESRLGTDAGARGGG